MKQLSALILVFGVLLLSACGGGSSSPTLVPTLVLPTAAPTVTASAVTPTPSGPLPPTPTQRRPPSTRTPWPTDTPTPAVSATPTPTVEVAGCDADTLTAYEAVVTRLQSVYAALESQDYTQEALLAAIPQMSRVGSDAEALPAPCDRAYWLRLTIVERVNAELADLQKFADNPNQGDPRAAIVPSPLIEDALDALRQEVEAATTPGAPTDTPTPAPFLCDCSGDLYDCDYFRTQAEAQSCYDYCLPRAGDIHALDPDGNGQACESLP